jgi:hypothetical protein
MLAQNFKTAADLGIEDVEFDALTKVLGMLERGEIKHTEIMPRDFDEFTFDPVGLDFRFNMDTWVSHADECGTVCCIGGSAELIGKLPPGRLLDKATSGHRTPVSLALFRLFYPDKSPEKVTPAQAALALRSYLTTGDANWAEALA